MQRFQAIEPICQSGGFFCFFVGLIVCFFPISCLFSSKDLRRFVSSMKVWVWQFCSSHHLVFELDTSERSASLTNQQGEEAALTRAVIGPSWKLPCTQVNGQPNHPDWSSVSHNFFNRCFRIFILLLCYSDQTSVLPYQAKVQSQFLPEPSVSNLVSV